MNNTSPTLLSIDELILELQDCYCNKTLHIIYKTPQISIATLVEKLVPSEGLNHLYFEDENDIRIIIQKENIVQISYNNTIECDFHCEIELLLKDGNFTFCIMED